MPAATRLGYAGYYTIVIMAGGVVRSEFNQQLWLPIQLPALNWSGHRSGRYALSTGPRFVY